MNSLLRNTFIGSALLVAPVDTATAETKAVPEVIDQRAAFDGKLSKVLAEMEIKRELTLPETVAVMTYSSRREFCQAVVAWSQSFIDEIQYPDEEEFNEKRELIPVGIGQGEFFEQVLAPTISKGCLSPKERRAYFDYYKNQALQIYVKRIDLIYKIIAPYKKDIKKDEIKAARFKKGLEYIKALQIKLEKEQSIKYEDLFKDEAIFEVPVADGRYYTDAVKLLEKLKKSPNDLSTLGEVTTNLNAYDKLYNSSNLSDEDKEDLLKGIMLLMDYQITLIHNAVPVESAVVSSTINTEGTATGETEFEAVMSGDSKRRFEVPQVRIEDELKKTQVYVANNDSYWLRLAELDFYTYAARDFLAALGDRPNLNGVKQWERSMEVASRAFAELPSGREASAGIYKTLATHHDDQWVLDLDYDSVLLQAPKTSTAKAVVRKGYEDKYGYNPYLKDYTFKYTLVLMNPNACNESVKGMNKHDSAGWIVPCGFGVGDNLDHVFEKVMVLPPERKARVDEIGGETADVPLGFFVKIAKEHMTQ